MNFLRTMLHYAGSAWNALWGAATDPVKALEALWKFVGSLHNLLDHLTSIILKALHLNHLSLTHILITAMRDFVHMVARIAAWIWGNQVNPVRLHLLSMILKLRAWTASELVKVNKRLDHLYWLAINFTRKSVKIEFRNRVKAIQGLRRYTIQLVKGALRQVDREASDGYKSGNPDRKSVIGKVADLIVTRNPELKGLVSDLISLVLDAASLEDPLIRVGAKLLLTQVIDKLGIDKVVGDLLNQLINDLIGGGQPTTLEGVSADVAKRLSALENQWASFMSDGGPEVEQAGKQWQFLSSLLADAAMVAFVGDAVVNPVGWARDVDAALGDVANDTIDAVAHLFKAL